MILTFCVAFCRVAGDAAVYLHIHDDIIETLRSGRRSCNAVVLNS
jgi:hypothetical protein